MSRPTKNVTQLKGHRTKEELESRMQNEQAITGNSDAIFIPAFIEDDEVAVGEFLRLSRQLEEVGLLTNVDIGALGLYADAYSKYVESTICMRNQPLIIEYTNKGGETNPIANPYIKVQQQYAERMMKLSASFGLDPASRGKIASLQPKPLEEDDDELGKIINNLKGGK